MSLCDMYFCAEGLAFFAIVILQVILNMLKFGKDLRSAITEPRLHNQLYPDKTKVEDEPYNTSGDIIKGLEDKGHVIDEDGHFAVVQGIVRSGGFIHATSDPRKGGKPDGF